MIASLGQGALITAAILSGILPLSLWGINRYYNWALTSVLKWGRIFITGMITLALLALGLGFYLDDFSLRVVAEHGHTTLSLLNRIGALWGHHEGSMLLFTWIYTLYAFAYKEWKAQAFHWFFLTCFLLYLIFLSSPFDVLAEPPTQGGELNPLLQDPLLMIHPPILYAGYAGFSVPFCLTLKHLIEESKPGAFLMDMRISTLIAWSFLTLGVALGSLWAYDELGWGGWWFWDPVENASLLPWVFATCLLHTVQGAKHHPTWSKGIIAFALITYGMTLLSFVLVRSGVLSSVHSFASDPSRGQGLGVILALSMAMAACCWFLREKKPIVSSDTLSLYSRGPWYGFFLMIWSCMGLTLFMGTLYPFLSEFLGYGGLTVGEPYFVKTVVPLALIGLIPMAFILVLAWQPLPRASLIERGQKWGLLSLSVFLVWGYGLNFFTFLQASAFILSGSVFISIWTRPAKWPLKLAHGGFALCVMGMVFDTALSTEQAYALKPGQTLNVKGKSLTFERIERGKEKSYMYEKAYIWVKEPSLHKEGFYLLPEKRFYPSHQTLKTETAIKDTFFSHLYVVLGGVLPDGRWTFRIATHPWVDLIWFGALLMALGGFLKTITLRRRRV